MELIDDLIKYVGIYTHMIIFEDQAILVVVDEWAAQVLIGAPGASAGRYCYLMDWVSSY